MLTGGHGNLTASGAILWRTLLPVGDIASMTAPEIGAMNETFFVQTAARQYVPRSLRRSLRLGFKLVER